MGRLGLLVAGGILLASGCDDPREWRSRQAVRQLVKAGPLASAAARARVIAEGRYALVDIEQEIHAADLTARLRLLAAVEGIGDPEAIPLLRFLERWADDDAVRERAHDVRVVLQRKQRK